MNDTEQSRETYASWDEEGVNAGAFEAFEGIVAALRGESGCPWDKKQTFDSLKTCLINETVEALGAIDLHTGTGDADNLCEELGDVLLQVVLLAQIAKEEQLFDIHDVIRGISRKMLRRHPHVFGEKALEADPVFACALEQELAAAALKKPEGATEVPGRWDAIKRAEKRGRTPQQLQGQKDACAGASAWVTEHLRDHSRQ